MPITKNSGRQEVIVGMASFKFSDLVSGAAQAAIDLPAKARVLDVYLKIGTAFNSGTSDAMVIRSNEGTPKVYITIAAAAGALSAGLTARAANTNLSFVNNVPSTIDVLWTGVGTAATTGDGVVVVEYVVDNRAAFSQG
jgi:hypothetical protein